VRILVTGGCGYIGSALIPFLLSNGHEITNLDLQWFGNPLMDDPKLANLKVDLRDFGEVEDALTGCQAVIHLAGMTNDQACRAAPTTAQSVNVDAFSSLLNTACTVGVRRFIFLSSGAAYGNSEVPIQETQPLKPTTPYGLYKKACEEMFSFLKDDRMKCFILRPGGVFGYTPRMRFDLMVNMMTAHACLNGVIKVSGGEQMRPHVHIRDLMDVIYRLLYANISSRVFNVVHENQAVLATAISVRDVVRKVLKREVQVDVSERTDDRSYLIDGDKLKRSLSTKCRRNLGDGVLEVCKGFQRGLWKDALENKVYSNVPTL
jgi:nucleoside-diphosphate-sugar epimerase